MPQDAFHLRRIANELNILLQGGKVNRIAQANKDELTFHIYTKKTTVKLILSTNASNARVCLTLTEKEPAPVAPNFCMLLRKHLVGAEILAIRQVDFERILEIDLHCTGDFSECDRTLHCEIMGKYSNLVLTEKEVILGALKPSSIDNLGGRPLLAGVKYAYPASQDKVSPFDTPALLERLRAYAETRENSDADSLAKFVFENVSGLALPTARELVRRCPKLTEFPAFLKDACENLPNEPHLLSVNGEPTDFFAFAVSGGTPTPSLLKAEDEFYTHREGAKGFADKKRKLESAVKSLLKKLSKRIQETLEKLKEAENAEEYRIKGELLTANLYRVEKGQSSIVLENWYEEGCPPVKIALDATLPPAKNAQRYFKTYNKHKRAKEVLTPMLQAEEEEKRYAESILSGIALAETETDLKEIELELIGLGLLRAPKEKVGAKKKTVETPFREYEKDGFRILAGRNNLQNDRLLRLASPDDLWLHTQKYHSSHVLIVREGKKIPDGVLLYAAELCAYYSDGRESGKIPVDYCERKHVKKPNKAKAGFVIYTNYQTVLVEPKKP